MSVCAGELAALLRLPRGVDLKAVAARLDGRVYQATGVAMVGDGGRGVVGCDVMDGRVAGRALRCATNPSTSKLVRDGRE
jgi:hypothetical protein